MAYWEKKISITREKSSYVILNKKWQEKKINMNTHGFIYLSKIYKVHLENRYGEFSLHNFKVLLNIKKK